ncbi:hypothetical protein AGR7A_Cc70002 [Agrobacterium deltaense NCPPB 1641]|uniref:Uncharacterized protein n=1 Tax=Agrobacterium deltaense NCPPB 1641 TaxID=1183425 RepID=A0A1S7TRP1_9HYPH|nr:hypothetical protein AGR7A_Cc70002 [Agrobacterium deltaense NCPPB 1641]
MWVGITFCASVRHMPSSVFFALFLHAGQIPFLRTSFRSYAAAHAAAEGESLRAMWAFCASKSSDSFVTPPLEGAWQPCAPVAGDCGDGAGASEELWLKKGNGTLGYIAKIDFLT